MTDSTQSHPAIAEQRLPLGVCWVQPTLAGWTHIRSAPDKRDAPGGDRRRKARGQARDPG